MRLEGTTREIINGTVIKFTNSIQRVSPTPEPEGASTSKRKTRKSQAYKEAIGSGREVKATVKSVQDDLTRNLSVIVADLPYERDPILSPHDRTTTSTPGDVIVKLIFKPDTEPFTYDGTSQLRTSPRLWRCPS